MTNENTGNVETRKVETGKVETGNVETGNVETGKSVIDWDALDEHWEEDYEDVYGNMKIPATIKSDYP